MYNMCLYIPYTCLHTYIDIYTPIYIYVYTHERVSPKKNVPFIDGLGLSTFPGGFAGERVSTNSLNAKATLIHQATCVFFTFGSWGT